MSEMKKEVHKMPRLDGTGPMGCGPTTGRGMGNCVNARRPMQGSGFNRGRRGGGFGRGYFASQRPYFAPEAYTEQPTKELLMDQKKYLEEELASISKELEKM